MSGGFFLQLPLINMAWKKNKKVVQFNSVDLYTEYRVLFFEENWNSKVKAVLQLLTLSVRKMEALKEYSVPAFIVAKALL